MTDVSEIEKPRTKINLHRGWPNPALLPSSSLQLAAATVLSDPDLYVSGLLYGPNMGDSRLRRSIAKWLTGIFSPDIAIKSERICITGGASQNLGSLLQVFSDPGYTLNVWLVVPCYMLACRIIEDAGFAGKLRSVPEDAEGIDLAYWEDELTKAEADAKAKEKGQAAKRCKADRIYRKSYRHILYAVPTFSNPSSTLMTLRRREGLVRLARRFDALVICDDVYDFLHWSIDRPSSEDQSKKAVIPRLVDVDRFLDSGTNRTGADGFGNVASNGTFSKIVAPGLRCGWVEGTESFSFGLSEAGTTVSGGAPSHITAVIVASMLESGELQAMILEQLQPSYSRRHHILRTAINSRLVPLGCLITLQEDVAGGYFIWLRLPDGLSGDHVASRAAEKEYLIVAAGSMFEVSGDCEKEGTHFENYLRLCFAWEDEVNLERGIERLSRVIKELIVSPPGDHKTI